MEAVAAACRVGKVASICRGKHALKGIGQKERLSLFMALR